MLDILTRALLHPVDYSGVFSYHRLKTLDHFQIGDNIHIFTFTKPDGLTWQAGQHAIFNFPWQKIKGRNWRPFSIASSHHEGVIRVATIIPEPHTEFKSALANLDPGEPIIMHGPLGEFHTNASKCTIVGIAAGVAVTPFRALAYEIANGHLPHQKLHLIFSAREVFAFKGEFDHWQETNERITVTYNHTPEEVHGALKKAHSTYGNDACYFISGSPGMINALQKGCRDLGIRTIVNDPFKGY